MLVKSTTSLVQYNVVYNVMSVATALCLTAIAQYSISNRPHNHSTNSLHYVGLLVRDRLAEIWQSAVLLCLSYCYDY